MEESWRTRMGIPTAPPPTRHIPNHPPRRSTGDDPNSHRHKPISGEDPLSPEDFIDVFGGPPRTILTRQFSTGFPRSSSYDEIFRVPSKAAPFVGRGGRRLPEFRIPDQPRRSDRDHHHHQQQQHRRESNCFYTNILGCYHEDRVVVRSRSRSKTSSSSVLSSEELSPLRHGISGDGDDQDVSYFASKLRPINVGSEWLSRRMGHEDYQRQQDTPPCSGVEAIYNTEKNCTDNLQKYPFEPSGRNASPETISMEPMSNNSFGVSTEDLELNSPSSPLSSVCHMDMNREQRTRDIDSEILRQDHAMEQEEDDDAMSYSYVIEINSDYKEAACESNGVDEAIAWAKEKFQTHINLECEKEKATKEMLNEDKLSEVHTDSFRSEIQTEMEILDEKINLWSTGKETDIRLLLSSLHNILWDNSGWSVIPLWNILKISEVKKAYQRACLCLHPDKLQQRGATCPQKYVAQKAFAVLQDAWATFISRDVLKNC